MVKRRRSYGMKYPKMTGAVLLAMMLGGLKYKNDRDQKRIDEFDRKNKRLSKKVYKNRDEYFDICMKHENEEDEKCKRRFKKMMKLEKEYEKKFNKFLKT
jgi:hypothetical protein